MRTRLLILALLLATNGALGCRTVWVHPEASREKYTADSYRCRYGQAPPSEEEILQGEIPDVRRRHGWKECMALLGWTPKTGMRASPPYSQ
jgi:hypothetical protein